jgi:hypothetical protein
MRPGLRGTARTDDNGGGPGPRAVRNAQPRRPASAGGAGDPGFLGLMAKGGVALLSVCVRFEMVPSSTLHQRPGGIVVRDDGTTVTL